MPLYSFNPVLILHVFMRGNFMISACLSLPPSNRHVSFVDCPGHDILMATMLNGAAVMDAALLLIGMFNPFRTVFYLTPFSPAGNESCPQPQTSEHLAAIEIMKLKHILILQNKIDLIRDTQVGSFLSFLLLPLPSLISCASIICHSMTVAL